MYFLKFNVENKVKMIMFNNKKKYFNTKKPLT